MPKRVLDVGQCNVDHSSISRFVKQRFGAEITRAHDGDEALEALRGGAYDLVLINRKLDMDGSDGISVLKAIKKDSTLADVPVMLVSNYEDAQQQAVKAGAEPGFGKNQLGSDEAAERLAPFLQE